MSKLFLKCEEANHICDKAQYKEASLFEKLKLNLHLIFCSFCRKYSINNAKLTECIDESNVECMEDSKKTVMKQNFEKELAKHQH